MLVCCQEILQLDDKDMDDVILRLKKVNGQIQGLIRMVENSDNCEKVIVQFQAAKAALDKTYSLVLDRSLKECMSHNDTENVGRILKLISKH
ncbi:metal-sensitive transcriptional regulator [Chlorobium phaeobacteroides]|jgi:DNA-binding FrmR family transcriptional regulator|uniref:Transcriptional regulator n=1 Tax=Chlorobium phaeobacteroides (strain DSM 266 / SMG 266 / 2430) TaxID=290317 RepID=A1BCX4_CHLPD|nr:conserved hypothetical protein [Chlorobium phaeobacteroides DSM 266]